MKKGSRRGVLLVASMLVMLLVAGGSFGGHPGRRQRSQHNHRH
jgi:hypothetical protein